MIEQPNTNSAAYILENITRTLLYEGYSLYPYNRSAIKNQKPVPFGIVFPKQYNLYNQYAHSIMQTECIAEVNNDAVINMEIRFLQLITTKIFQAETFDCTAFQPVFNLSVNNKYYQSGWQTIERKINCGSFLIDDLNKEKSIPFHFDKEEDSELIYDEHNNIAGKKIIIQSEIKGEIIIYAVQLAAFKNSFKITLQIINNTAIEQADSITRDEALTQSLLSAHSIFNAKNGIFISQQDAGEKYKQVTADCKNLNCYPVLIDNNNTTLLSSPIALYDHPQINPQSAGDLFDSTEIEEALLLHVGMLSEDEQQRISETDEKLKAMLKKVNNISPQEMINFHSYLQNEKTNTIKQKNNV